MHRTNNPKPKVGLAEWCLAKTSDNQMSGLDGMWNKTLAQNRVFPFRWFLCTDFIRGNHHETIISRHRLKANLRTWEVNFRINGVIPGFLWEITNETIISRWFFCHDPFDKLCIRSLEVIGTSPRWSLGNKLFLSMVTTLSLPNGPQGALHLLAPEVWKMFRNFAESFWIWGRRLTCQWLTFKLFGITDLVGKISFNFYFMALRLSKKVFRKRGCFFLAYTPEDERIEPENDDWVVVSNNFWCSPLPDLPAEIIQFDKYFSTGLKPPTRWFGNFGRWCSSSSDVFSGSMLIFWGVSMSAMKSCTLFLLYLYILQL